YAKAGEALVARKDKSAVPELVSELKKRYDHLNDIKPHATEVLARALAAAQAQDAWPALVEKLRDPSVPALAVREIALALKSLRAAHAVPALREFLLMYRA